MQIARKYLVTLAALATPVVCAAALGAPAMAASAGVRTASTARPAPAKPAKSWIVNDPKAYAAAVKSKNWVHTPEGLAYKSCVYDLPPGAIFDHGVIVKRNGTRTLTTCTHPTLAYPRADLPHTLTRPTRPGAVPDAAACPAVTNPNWWADSCAVAPTWLTNLSERFSVPSNPTQDGALIYFFPGFTDSTGATILQPVLTWGANTTSNNVSNPNIWYITNWYVIGDGRFMHSNNVHVGAGDTIDGSISATGCSSNGANCTWTVSSNVEGGTATTPLTVVSGVPFTLVWGGVMEVPTGSGCVETPPNGHEAFRNLAVTTHSGSLTPAFTSHTPFPECSVSETSSSTGADILWKS
jgi:hypothetical protein